jgi:hypothetical protein
MAVTIASQPATLLVSASSGTTSAFTVNASSGYVVCVSLGTNQGSPAAASTVTWGAGGSGTWTKLASFNVNQFQPTVEIWFAPATATVASSTVTITGNADVTGITASVTEVTGHGATQNGASATSSASPFNTITLTPNQTGSLVFCAMRDVNEAATVTANGASTVIVQSSNIPSGSGQTSYTLVSSANTTASTAVTLGVTNTLTANIQLALEIVPSAGSNFTQTVTDSAGVTDNYVRNYAAIQAATDNTGLTDQPAAQVANYVQTMTDTAGVTDVMSQAFSGATNWTQTITDTAGVTDAVTQVYAGAVPVLFTPPRWLHHQVMEGSLVYSIPTCYGVYRQGGAWFQFQTQGIGNPDTYAMDIDPTQGRLFFTTPTKVTAAIAADITANFTQTLQPTDLPYTLTAVPSWPAY